MLFSTDSFLLFVAIFLLCVIVTSGIIYGIWCAKCCRLPETDPEGKTGNGKSSVPEGHAFYTTPWAMDVDLNHIAAQQVLSHPQLAQNFYSQNPNIEITNSIPNEEHGNSHCGMGNECMPSSTDALGGMGMEDGTDAMDEDDNFNYYDGEFNISAVSGDAFIF